MGDVELGARVLLAAVLILAVGGKVRAFAAFARSLRDVPVVPAALTTPAAVLLVAGEAAVAGLLVVPGTARLGSVAAVVLFGTFAVVVARLLWGSTRAACHCFGGSGVPYAPRHIVRNALLTGVAVVAALGPAPEVAPARSVIAAAAGVVLAVLVARWDDLAALFTPVTAIPPR